MAHISWDQYFMGVSKLSALRSKDPSTKVGACIVSADNRIVGVGYNGMPYGTDDEFAPWGRVGGFLDTKYAYVCHAELNAILNYRGDLTGSKVYVKLFPCNECAKAIIQAGIKEVIYKEDKYANADNVIASKALFDACGVKYTEYKSTGNKITLEL
jgi:dCMP deaminase